MGSPKIAVCTSSDGVDWKRQNVIPKGMHTHGAATYVMRNATFFLYSTGGLNRVSRDVSSEGGYEYETVPFEVPDVDGLTVHTTRPLRLVVNDWERDAKTIGSGTIEPMAAFGYGGDNPLAGDYESGNTQVQWELTGLVPGTTYQLTWNGEQAAQGRANAKGELLLTTILPEDGNKHQFTLQRK